MINKMKNIEIRVGRNGQDSKSASFIYAMSWKQAFRGIFSEKLLESIHTGFWIDTFNHNHKTKRFDIAIISDNGKDFGACGYGYSRDYNSQDYGEITSIYLLEEYWGKEYGKLLVEFMINQLKEKGCSKIHLWVIEENKRARRFYEKCGLVPSGNKKQLEFKGEVVNELEYVHRKE